MVDIVVTYDDPNCVMAIPQIMETSFLMMVAGHDPTIIDHLAVGIICQVER